MLARSAAGSTRRALEPARAAGTTTPRCCMATPRPCCATTTSVSSARATSSRTGASVARHHQRRRAPTSTNSGRTSAPTSPTRLHHRHAAGEGLLHRRRPGPFVPTGTASSRHDPQAITLVTPDLAPEQAYIGASASPKELAFGPDLRTDPFPCSTSRRHRLGRRPDRLPVTGRLGRLHRGVRHLRHRRRRRRRDRPHDNRPQPVDLHSQRVDIAPPTDPDTPGDTQIVAQSFIVGVEEPNSLATLFGLPRRKPPASTRRCTASRSRCPRWPRLRATTCHRRP